jgi:hypothetical protein
MSKNLYSISSRYEITKYGRIFALLVAAHASCLYAAEHSRQEEGALVTMRQSYLRATGVAPTLEDEEKMLAEWKASVIRDAARMTTSTTPIATQASSNVGGSAAPSTSVNLPANVQQLLQAAMQRSQSGGAANPAVGSMPSTTSMSDGDLMQKLNGTHAQVKVELSARRDGLLVNGRVFADPEGAMRAYSYDVVSGDVTYQIASNGGLVFKYFNPSTGVDPVILGNAAITSSGIQINLLSGSTLGGDSVIPMPRGMLVARGANLFVYEPGKAIQTVSIPDGWVLAPFQRGSVGATRTVLLENVNASNQQKDSSGLGSLLSATKSLGQLLGMNKTEDYAFLNLDTGRLIKLNISVDGKVQMVLSNCRKRNNFVNDCATASSFQSLYAPDGSRNRLHYFWQANWYQTPTGPIAVVQEGGLVDLFIIDLSTGKRVTAFHRAMGMTSTDTSQSSDGVVKVSASWLFQDHVIADAASFLSSNPEVGSEAAKN